MITPSANLVAAPVESAEDIFLATGGTERNGTITHIGGGLYIGHNHGRHGTKPGGQKEITFGLGLEGEQTVVRHAHYHFTQEGHLENPNVKGGGEDIALYVSNNPNDKIPAVPILIASDPGDLIGLTSITTRMAPPGSTKEGVVHYSTGDIVASDEDKVGFTNTVVAGMSGSGIFVQLDTNGDGVTEDYTIGVVTHYTKGTAWAGSTYTDLADTLYALGYDADLLPNYTLMSGFDQYSASHVVSGTYLNENIIGGTWHDTLSGGGGRDIIDGGAGNDTIDGGAGADTFVFGAGDGHDIIQDFVAGEDSIDVTQITSDDFVFSQNGADVLVTYGNGENSILFKGSDIATIQAVFPQSQNVIHGQDKADKFYGTDANDVIYGYGGKDHFYAGKDAGADTYIGGSGNNYVFYKSSTTGVTLDLENNIGAGGAAEGDSWYDIRVFRTSNHDDTIYGSSGTDRVWLQKGNDTFYGADGDDVVGIVAGTDYIDGGSGRDIVQFAKSKKHVIEVYAEDDARKTDAMNTYISVEEIHASNKADMITIGSGTAVDFVKANGGNDILTIFADSGVFYGGNGADEFHFTPDDLSDVSADLIIGDFTVGKDSLWVMGHEIDLKSGAALPQGFSYDVNANGDLLLHFGDDDLLTFTDVDAMQFI